ncbi:elongation factor P--(R)-beta-lysine ligase [Ferrimonas lipolytica]|uniref:Elongation factor P--(R)-beta-lysine ligase n=1 Tax=Ferrimonas lipolytica TaxID=2724191 RepID=A0A6H1UHP9_9GAMM|nr:elongation factor P--(R)-beta-lysine ligase [Ferrimonas lipolytica]QIZ78635.1 elongation factor P--(R)-beta-lysine ligase [Ferrimonas lipolytica]
MSWQPTADMAQLRQRGHLLAQIRQFFAERDVLEVDTPAMSQAAVTDPHLYSFETTFVGPGASQGLPLHLMTSPEFHMKRLLCAGSGCIYQIGKSFRNEESSRYHNPEFTMLEWYRVGFNEHDLMVEMAQLLRLTLGCGEPEKKSYQQVFIDALGLDPLSASVTELQQECAKHGLADIAQTETTAAPLQQMLFSMVIEPTIGQTVPLMVFDFPANQAALARINPDDPRVAGRFEVYFKAIELANGFYELADADEQLARFEQDNRDRVALGLPAKPIDHNLIAALRHGLPDCAGVALGIDRLLMLGIGVDHIEQVTAFPVSRA